MSQNTQKNTILMVKSWWFLIVFVVETIFTMVSLFFSKSLIIDILIYYIYKYFNKYKLHVILIIQQVLQAYIRFVTTVNVMNT